MGGGLMQLVAYGAQDVYLSADPQITFFKLVYRRHTNFSMESIAQTMNGTADFGKRVSATISRNGDLIYKTYLQVEIPAVTVNPGYSFRWLNWLGHILIKSVDIEIGGQRIDRQYGEWLHIWNELTQTAGHQLGYANMVGNTPQLTSLWTAAEGGTSITVPGQTLFIPLQFWWNNNPGLALPLIAMQYHECKINLELNEAKNCYWSGKLANPGGTPATPLTTDLSTAAIGAIPSLANCQLYIDYIYLDSDERRRFSQSAHEYLLTQLQFTGEESTSQQINRIRLSLNHPCRELIWVVQPTDNVSDSAPYGKQWFNYTDAYDNSMDPAFALNTGADATLTDIDDQGNTVNMVGGMPGVAAGGATGVFLPTTWGAGANPVVEAHLQLNGHQRAAPRSGRYYNLVQPYQHHENVPSLGINVYSFALKPEEHQPSGTCNFSRIDSATLNLTLTPNTVSNESGPRSATIKVFAVNYNVLRVMSGMAGLAYSN